MAAAGDAGRAASTLGARLEAETKRLTSYFDRATQSLARTAQVLNSIFSLLIFADYH